jgi:hypothetical protein
MTLPEGINGFEWDAGNIDKNWLLHHVTNSEAEEIFFNKPLVVPANYSLDEERYLALGITDMERRLTVVFIVRNNKIRIISARDMSGKEREVYNGCKE